MAKYLGTWIDHHKVFSQQFHQRIGEMLHSILGQPFYEDDLQLTLSHVILANILLRIAAVLVHENDLRVYVPLADELQRVKKNQPLEQQSMIEQWWDAFWLITVSKFPSIAVEHLDQFFHRLIDEKCLTMANLILVSFASRDGSLISSAIRVPF